MGRQITAILTLLVVGGLCLVPYCQQQQDNPLTKVLSSQETYRIDLSKFFKGTNLQYSLSEDVPAAQFEQRTHLLTNGTHLEELDGNNQTQLSGC